MNTNIITRADPVEFEDGLYRRLVAGLNERGHIQKAWFHVLQAAAMTTDEDAARDLTIIGTNLLRVLHDMNEREAQP